MDAQARGFGFAGARIGLGGARFAFGTGPRFGVRPGVQPGLGTGLRGRFGRFGRGYGLGGIGGFGGLGVGSYAFDGDGLPFGLPGVGGDPGAYPVPVAVPVAPSKPICPLIIKVGSGLRHAARTKVVYGHQPDCR